MGGGKDQKTANKNLEQQTAYQTSQQKEFDTRNKGDLDASRGRGDELYASLKGGFDNMLQSNVNTGQGGSGGGGGGGGYTPPALDSRFGAVEDQYKNFMSTGGWDPDVQKAQQGRIDQLGEMGKTGGIDDAAQARIRGGGVYDEFAKTGGLSDKDQANMRTRGTAPISAMYGRINDEANRGAAISGGFGPGRGVLAGRMARQQASGMADAALNTELGIKDKVNAGRQWGASGMTSSETGLQDLLTRNKMQGLTGASDIQGKMQESIMGGKQWGTTNQHGLVNEQQQRADEQAAQAAAYSAGAAGDARENERWNLEFNARQKELGLEGLGSLYAGGGSGEYNTNKDFALRSAGNYGDQVGAAASAQKTGNRSAWDTVGNIAGAVAGGMTGMGAIGAGIGAARGIAAGGNQNRLQVTPQPGEGRGYGVYA